MRLPDPAYDRGMSGLGREGPGAVTQYEVASRTNLETQNAKTAVLQQFQKLGDAAQDWIHAADQGEAELALSDYKSKIRSLETTLDNTPTYRPEDIPAGVKFERWESVNGEKVERQYIPAYEIRTALYDYHEKNYRTDALSRPSGTSKGALVKGITEFNSVAIERQREGEFKGRLDYLTATRNQLIADSVQKGDIQTASIAIEQGVKLGLYGLDQGREMLHKANSDHEKLTFGRAIVNAQTPEQLEQLSLDITQTAQWLAPGEAFALSTTAQNRADALDAKRTAAYEKATTQASARLRADATLSIASSGKPMSWDAIAALNLKPSDMTALIAVNKAASESRPQHDDPGTAAELESAILGLAMPGAATHTRKQAIQQRIIQQLDDGKITPGTASTMMTRTNTAESLPVSGESYKTAVDLGYTQIVGGNPASASFFGGDAESKQRAVQFELDLRQATLDGADPMAWMQKNVANYKKTAPTSSRYVVRTTSGQVDLVKSRAAITKDYEAGMIDAAEADRRENELNLIK